MGMVCEKMLSKLSLDEIFLTEECQISFIHLFIFVGIISLPKLPELQSLAQESTNYDYESAEYRVTAIILDTAQYKLFRPVHSDLLSTDAKTHFIKLDFINKGIDAVNLPSILRSKSVTETVSTYFKDKEPPIISYTYTDWDKNLSLLCEAVDQYALQWAEREMVELSVLSSWREMVKAKLKSVFPS